MHRLFAALRPPAPIRAALRDAIGGVEGARWQDEDQLHLTLRFAGELEGPHADDLASALSRVDAPGFTLNLRGAGHFEKKGIVHTLWAGVEESEPLAVLHRRVERACRSVGIPPERRVYAPHVTLAQLNRSCGPADGWLAANARFSAGPWVVEDFRLYESHLTPQGAEYWPLERYPLG